MALTQDDRIAISKKLVDIPKEDASSADNKDKLLEAQGKAQQQDNANKSLMDDKTALINSYQLEMKRLDGNDRTEVVEQDIVDTAKAKVGNFFAPNDTQTPTPSLPDGVWKQFVPFSGSKAIGKLYNETYGSTPKEDDSIATVSSSIVAMEAFTAIQRSTGQSCGASGTCSIPMYTDQASCEAATPTPGVWTPGPDVIANDPAVQSASAATIAAVNAWKTFLQGTLAIIVTTDTNVTRQGQNNAAIADINNSISVINAWLALPDFDTNHGQTTCAGFNSYNVNLLNPTKYRAAELTVLKNQITARQAFIPTRVGQLSTNLGGVVQNFTDGSLTSTTGFYGERFNIINLRLNLMTGSARKVAGIALGINAQDQAVASNASASSVYSSVMFVSLFRAPAAGTEIVHVKDASGFTNGDTVYVISDTQQEITATVVSKIANMLTLSVVIPAKYRQNENARVYKVL